MVVVIVVVVVVVVGAFHHAAWGQMARFGQNEETFIVLFRIQVRGW